MEKFVCVSCKKKLENVFNDLDMIQPSGGVAFSGQGTYGSKFDTAEETMIVVLCDDCLSDMFTTVNGVYVEEVTIPAVKTYVSISEDDLNYL